MLKLQIQMSHKNTHTNKYKNNDKSTLLDKEKIKIGKVQNIQQHKL